MILDFHRISWSTLPPFLLTDPTAKVHFIIIQKINLHLHYISIIICVARLIHVATYNIIIKYAGLPSGTTAPVTSKNNNNNNNKINIHAYGADDTYHSIKLQLLYSL